MGQPDFGRLVAYPAPPIAHALHDDDVNVDVIEGDLVEAVHNGIPIVPEAELEPEPALPLGCRWRVPLTWVHNPSGVLLIY